MAPSFLFFFFSYFLSLLSEVFSPSLEGTGVKLEGNIFLNRIKIPFCVCAGDLGLISQKVIRNFIREMKENRNLGGESKRGWGLELMAMGSYRRIFKICDTPY